MLDALFSALPWIVVGICLLTEAFFAAAEISIVSADGLRLETAARGGSAAAKRVRWFRDHPDRLFGTTLVGTNISTVIGSTVASLTLVKVSPEHGGWWAMLLMSPLILIGAELVPKSLGQARAEVVSQRLAGPLYFVHRVLFPVVWLLRTYTRYLYRVLGISPDELRVLVSREELALLIDGGDEEHDELESDEREMISRIFAFSQLRARESMVPLAEMVVIDEGATVVDAVALISREGFSRLPVFQDRVDNIVGILHHLDLLKAERGDQPVRALMRPAFFVPESQEIDDILVILQREAATAAIVVDEFGGAVGLLTLEDVLEEIIGEIADEYDSEESKPWRPAPEGGHLLNARATVEQVNEGLGQSIPESPEYETVAGYVLFRLRHIPNPGESVRLPSGHRLTVRRATERAIQELHLSATPVPPRRTKSADTP